MLDDLHQLDRVVRAGPVPPGPALELVSSLLSALERRGKPCGPTAFKLDKLTVDARGQVALGHGLGNDAAGDLRSVGEVMFAVVNGAPLSTTAALGPQLEDAKATLGLWPSGLEVAGLLQELLGADDKLTAKKARQRCDVLRARVGGVPLATWLFQSLGTPDPAHPRVGFDADGVDQLTGAFPTGMLAHVADPQPNAGRAGAPGASLPDFKVKVAADQKVERKGTVEEVLDKLTNGPALTPSSSPSPKPPIHERRRRSSGPPLLLWVAAAGLLALALLFLWILL